VACRLAGMPVPQRPAASNKRAADGDNADKKAEAVNGNTLSSKNLRFDLSGTQTAGAKPEPASTKKRPAEDDLTPTPTASNFKRARVEDAVDEGEKPAILGLSLQKFGLPPHMFSLLLHRHNLPPRRSAPPTSIQQFLERKRMAGQRESN
jgi:hypothetical protein